MALLEQAAEEVSLMHSNDDPGRLASLLATWRAETPGCTARIHLNNAGAALMPNTVVRAIVDHLKREAEIGGYEAAEEAADRIEDVYRAIAALLRAVPHNVAIVENATVAVAQALSAFDLQPGDRIVTSGVDYPSNQLMYLALAKRRGVEIIRARDLSSGGIDPDHVRELARHPRCRLVSMTWLPTNSGLVQPAEAIGDVCRDLGVPYLIDACQAVGQMPLDVRSLGCDFLAATARKFLRGPRGIGFLYVSDRMLAGDTYPLSIDMRGAEWTQADDFRLARGARRFENWEFPYALVLGLGEAIRYSLSVGESAYGRAHQLAAYSRTRLGDIAGVRVVDRGATLSAIVSVHVPGREPEEIKCRLQAGVGTGAVNTSVSLREDGVLDMDAKGVTAVLRVSPHYYNTHEEVDAFVAALSTLIKGG
jgi:selenocysteine lyase/cysteine desulfurase